MTGTGTQADPFIPATLTELVTAVGTIGAYVALDSDIDAAKDPEYTDGLYNTISWAAADVDGRDHSLIGVTMFQATLIQTTRIGTLRNIIIRNCALKRGTSSGIIINGYNGILNISNSTMGFKVDSEAGSNACVASHINCTDCSMTVEYTGDASTTANVDTILERSNFTRTTILLRGLTSSKQIRLLSWQASMERSAIIMENTSIGSMYIAYNSTSYLYSYVAFIGSLSSGNITCNIDATTSIVATDSEIGITTTYGWTIATIDQMKDKDWLTSVGFLP